MKKIMQIIVIFLFFCKFSSVYSQDHYVTSVARGGSSWLRTIDECSKFVLPAESGTQIFKLKTNLDVYVVSRPYWLTVSQIEVGTLKLEVHVNTAKISREGKIILKAKDNKILNIEVIQVGSESEVYTNKDFLNFYGDKQIDSIQIFSNISYILEVPEWISATGSGNGKFLFTAKKLYNKERCTDQINVVDSTGMILKTISVHQYYTTSDWYEKPCFAVISDIHFGDETSPGWKVRIPRVLHTLNSYNPKIRNLFIVGDLANNCLESQYNDIATYFSNSNLIDQSIKKTFIRGNHDNYRDNGPQLFSKYFNQPFNQYFEMQGYPVITIGCNSSEWRFCSYSYNPETLSFLKKSLADAADKYPGKPIFVFNHIVPKGTVIGSYDDDMGGYVTGLDEILKEYPQIIDFTAHTHFAITDPHQIYQKDYTVVNDGSQKMDMNATHWPTWQQLNAEKEIDYDAVTEGLIVHVDAENRVIIERWNTARNEKYDKDWIISPPFDGTNFTYINRTGGTAPWWGEGAQLSTTIVNDTICYLTFPQAKDDDDVYRYVVNIEDSEGTKVITPINQFSLLNFASKRPNKITIPILGLPVGTELKATVVPYDAYDKAGPKLSLQFVIPV